MAIVFVWCNSVTACSHLRLFLLQGLVHASNHYVVVSRSAGGGYDNPNVHVYSATAAGEAATFLANSLPAARRPHAAVPYVLFTCHCVWFFLVPCH